SPDAETAYAARSERYQNAWRAPPVREQPWLEVQRRKYKPGLASDPLRTVTRVVPGSEYVRGDSAEDRADFHFDDDDAQQRRDDAHTAYVDRLRNAWREP